MLSCKSGVGPLKTGSGEVIVSDVEKAEVLNTYFTCVFTVDNGIFPDFGRRVDKNIFISEIDFFSADIVKVITQMKNVKTADPHGFNNCFLKRLKFILAGPLSIVYVHIFSVGKIPNAWRIANITPVFKHGISSDVSNYQPISLTLVFCKIFERILKLQMLSHLLENNLITRQLNFYIAFQFRLNSGLYLVLFCLFVFFLCRFTAIYTHYLP